VIKNKAQFKKIVRMRWQGMKEGTDDNHRKSRYKPIGGRRIHKQRHEEQSAGRPGHESKITSREKTGRSFLGPSIHQSALP